jgi:hypothetical protein
MARKILQDLNYTFIPSTKTIVLPRFVPREKLILITNLRTNTVIYNFSDPNLTATSYTPVAGQLFPQNTAATLAPGQTTIVLNYNTTSMLASDKLQIMVDEYEERFLPAETMFDPANKLRVSNPQALIDTDFEYGLQPTKWEFYMAQNHQNTVYQVPGTGSLAPVYIGAGISFVNSNNIISVLSNVATVTFPTTLSSAPPVGSYVYVVDAAANSNFQNFRYLITASTTSTCTFSVTLTNGSYTPQVVVIGGVPGTAAYPTYVAVSVSNTLGPSGYNFSAGTPIIVQETLNETYSDGTFFISYINLQQNAFAYLSKSASWNQNILQKAATAVYPGGIYGTSYGAGAYIQVQTMYTLTDVRTVYVTTYTGHGLTVGAPIQVFNSTQAAANGSFYVTGVLNEYTFYYVTPYGTVSTSQSQIAQVVVTNNQTIATTQVIARPEGYQLHRAGDGGIQISPGNTIFGAMAMRQTRRFFRYQSGKGIQFSTATTFKPNYDVVSLSVSGTTCQVTTDQDHGLQPGVMVNLTNIIPSQASGLSTYQTDYNIYNNTFVVRADQPITNKTFYITLSGTPTDTNPGGVLGTVEIADGKGFITRLGLFTDMDGFFWEYDGLSLNAVRRNGTSSLRGTASVLAGSNLVIGTGTLFTRQLYPYDTVNIRGMSYRVKAILNDVACIITPSYRAATPASSFGTAGIPFATITAAGSQTQTINITSSTTTNTVTYTFSSNSTYTGASGTYNFVGTRTSDATSTGVAGTGTVGVTGATSMAIASTNSSIKPGMLVQGAGVPLGTYVATTYKSGVDTTIGLYFTQGYTGLTGNITATSYYFFYAVAPGSYVALGTGIQSATAVSSTLHISNSPSTTATVAFFINNSMTAQAASTYTFGGIPGPISNTVIQQPAQVIALTDTYQIAPGMLISSSNGSIPNNVVVAAISPIGTAVVLSAALTTAITNNATWSFSINNPLFATPSSGAGALTVGTTVASGNQITMASTYGVTGITVGSFVTNSANIPLGTYVIAINPSSLVITLSANITGSISSGTTLVFGNRINVVNSTNQLLNGQWPVTAVTASTITFQTSSTVTSGTYFLNGTTRVFGEDAVVKKYYINELRFPSWQFNLDTLDGTGPSGYNADLTKIQMIYMDYTWYGAGFIRWGIRTINGDIAYAHKLQHGNTQYRAYMRSGNLPGRFKAFNFNVPSPITTNILATGYTVSPTSPGTISVYDASKYMQPFSTPDGSMINGEVLVDGEYFYYSGLTATTGTTPWGTIATVATITANGVSVSGGQLVSVSLSSAGSGYTFPPPVTISGGGGAGAQAKAILNGLGGVDRIVVTRGGSGYTSAPTVTIGANQLSGVVRESNIVTIGSFTGTPTTVIGSTAITNVSNASQYRVWMYLAPNAAFGNVPLRITGISGTTVYVNIPAITAGTITIAPLQKGTNAVAHYADNSSGNPRTNAIQTISNATPSIQHWGVSAMMDGRYDVDKSYIYTTPRQTAAALQPNQTAPLISIRVSPSTSQGYGRNFGVRDVINHMQMALYQMDVYNSGSFLITVKYNCSSPIFTPPLWNANSVGSGSLSQVIYHNPQDVISGGDIVTAFYANASGGTFFTSTSQDLTNIKDLGSSVVGGDSVYPDGPDVVTIFATNLSASATQALYSRISWTEAQA